MGAAKNRGTKEQRIAQAIKLAEEQEKQRALELVELRRRSKPRSNNNSLLLAAALAVFLPVHPTEGKNHE